MHKTRILLVCLLLAALLGGCTAATEPAPENKAAVPPMPSKISEFEDGVPVLEVYVTESESLDKMTLEEYLYGVLAGEMKNDWPLEALKAQAILARSFVLKFMTEKESKYGGADISTDIEEAQAYDASSVNDRIRQAVDETKGMVLSANGELPYAWFHAHSGGKTEYAKPGLNWNEAEPGYTRIADGHENESAAPDAIEWTATFSSDQIIAAARKAGYNSINTLDSMDIGEKSESGRAVTLMINGQQVNAPDFRIAIGSTEMRSTMITELTLSGGQVTMSGKGFGHGVGMSQWGAYALAEGGMRGEEIVLEYFQNVEVVKMY